MADGLGWAGDGGGIGDGWVPGAGPDPVERPVDVVCLGHAIVDAIAVADDDDLERLALPKGAMCLVDAARMESVSAVSSDWREVPGGSAANTAAGVASLGGRATFVGTVAADELGEAYARALEADGVRCLLHRLAGGSGCGEGEAGRLATGQCRVLVTPDAERTMATHLGAAACLDVGCIERAGIETARLCYAEGYLLDAPSATAGLARALAIARDHGTLVALSLSDPLVVARHRHRLESLVRNDVDILFGNEEELLVLTGAPTLDDALAQISSLPPATPGGRRVAVATRGVRGAWLVDASGEVVRVPARPVEAVDTTGAGDLFAAGVLVGLARDLGLEAAGYLGALCAAEVVSHLGARPLASLAELARAAGLLDTTAVALPRPPGRLAGSAPGPGGA